MEVPRIRCTTCKAKLRIRRPEAVGQIVACPKCGSMVMVAVPSDVSSDPPAPADPPDLSASGSPTAENLQRAAEHGVELDTPLVGQADQDSNEAAQSDVPQPDIPQPDIRGVGNAQTPQGPNADAPTDPGWADSVPIWKTLPFVVTAAAGVVVLGGAIVWIVFARGTEDSDRLVPTARAGRPETEGLAHGDTPEMENFSVESEDGLADETDLAADPVETPQQPSGEASTDRHLEVPSDSGEAPERSSDVSRASRNLPTEVPETAPTADSIDPANRATVNETPSDEGSEPVQGTERRSADTDRLVNSALDRYGDLLTGPVATGEAGPDAVVAEFSDDTALPQDNSEVDDPGRSSREAMQLQMVARRLALPLTELSLRGQTLNRMLDLVAELTEVPIHIQPNALALRAVRTTQRVEDTLRQSSLGENCAAVLGPLGLEIVPRPGSLELRAASAEPDRLDTIRYRIGDLAAGNDEQLYWLADQIPRLVQPTAWESAGGVGHLETIGEELVVRQVPEVHWQVLRFLERMRVTRELPLRSQFDPAWFHLGLRSSAAKDWLDEKVDVDRKRPMRLSRFLHQVSDDLDLDVLADWAGLEQAGIMPDELFSVSIQGKTRSAALEQLLSDPAVRYRVIGPHLVQITTLLALETQSELEVHRIPDSLANVPLQTVLDEAARIVKRHLHGAHSETSIVTDPIARTLWVRVPHAVQVQIETWLRASAVDADAR